MCGYFCIGFIDFMLKGKSLLDDTNAFSPNDKEWKNNTKIFTMTKKIEIKKINCVNCDQYRKFRKPEIYIFEKT